MKKSNLFLIAGSVVVLVALIVGGLVVNKDRGRADQQTEDVAAFYNGKNIKLIVPYNPGGGYDKYARLLSPFLSKYTPTRISINFDETPFPLASLRTSANSVSFEFIMAAIPPIVYKRWFFGYLFSNAKHFLYEALKSPIESKQVANLYSAS